eukprot:Opistho-2@90766
MSGHGGNMACAEDLERAVEAHAAFARRLEEELARAHAEGAKMKDHYERRLKKLKTTSARSKAEYALSMFELKDEKSQLQEELSKLKDEVTSYKSRQSSASGARGGSGKAAGREIAIDGESGRGSAGGASESAAGEGDEADEGAGGHMRLIVDLSQQVASLDDQLTC